MSLAKVRTGCFPWVGPIVMVSVIVNYVLRNGLSWAFGLSMSATLLFGAVGLIPILRRRRRLLAELAHWQRVNAELAQQRRCGRRPPENRARR